MEKKYQVFISSTYKDLHEERQKVISILLAADCIPAGMEAFVATDQEQFAVIKKVIDLCDYYLLILGNRYGSISVDSGVSYTELEYDYAIAKGIPVLVFILDDESGHSDEEQFCKEKLKAFKAKVSNNRLVSMWKNIGDLQEKVSIAVMKAKTEFSRPGWMKSDAISSIEDISALKREISTLKSENKKLNLQIGMLLNGNDELAYQDETVTIEFYYFTGLFDKTHHASKILSWKELFSIVSLCLFHLIVKEIVIEKALKKAVFASDIEFSDPDLVRRIILQFEALGLIEYEKNGENWFYSLTKSGEAMRKKLLLVKKGEHI